MFFLISSTGSLNFIPFVNSSKTVIFLSFLPVVRGLFRLSERERKRREHFMQPFEATRVVIHQPSEEHPALCVQIEVNPILEALKLLFHFRFTSVSFLVRVYVTSG